MNRDFPKSVIKLLSTSNGI